MSQRREVREAFGHWVRSTRQSRGLSQEAAAMRAGISRIQWARIESGAGTRDGTVVNMAKALSVPEKEALERAGYSTGVKADDGNDRLSLVMIHFLSLPEEIQEATAKSLESLAQHYSSQKKAPRGKLEIVDKGGGSLKNHMKHKKKG